MVDAENIKYVFFCVRHGYDVNDGTKRECCDECQSIPMLSVEQAANLSSKGLSHFQDDFKKIQDFAHVVDKPIPADVSDWLEAADKINEIEPGEQAQTSGMGGEEEDEGADPFYIQGFTTGFTMGFDKGFDMGQKLSAPPLPPNLLPKNVKLVGK